ncbi:YXWGXW repeat-containing protein [Neoroseomonas soli]|uniref:BcpO-related WXXGXW repeat protein n=1 Tax=Neoroseomonas soli TaxID=1081025 RepID=A0A9X9X263_9PROT|nr:YXWGXW repeat-containing protein [Neoroseomonas soli]MBR0673492.1 BcpO-related WXXGXW repeat protein [Neoroseomonas soli]
MTDRRGFLALIPALGLAALAVPGTAEAQSVTLNFGPPPPPRYARPMPPPRRGHVWQEGHWRWNGRRYVWEDGRWIRARRGRHYAQPRWDQDGDRWRYRPGRWDRD